MDGIDFPPMGWNTGHLESGFPLVSPTFKPGKPWKIMYPGDAKEVYPYLMAVKIILRCKKMKPTEARGSRAGINAQNPGEVSEEP